MDARGTFGEHERCVRASSFLKSSTPGLACATAIKYLAFFHANHYLKLSEFLIFMKIIKNDYKKGI